MQLCRRILAAFAGLSLLPLVATLLTAMLTALLGCEAGDAGVEPCMIFGADAGGFLSGLLTLGGLAQLTIPLFMVLLTAWAVVEAWTWGRRRRRARRQVRRDAAA